MKDKNPPCVEGFVIGIIEYLMFRKPLILFLVLTFILIPTSGAFAQTVPAVCECVRWLRTGMGVNIRGDAWTIKPNVWDGTLQTGDVLLLEYGKVSHAALVLGFVDGRPVVIEANYKKCAVTERLINFEKETLRGVYRPKENAPQ